MLFAQRTRDVESLVDHLRGEDIQRSARADAPGALVLAKTHRDQEKHHAGEGEAAGVAQVACGETREGKSGHMG